MFSKLVVTKLLIRYLRTQNLYAIFVKILDICKKFGNDLVDARGNISRPGTKPRLEIVVLNLTMESLGIDCESFFFVLLQGYRKEIPNLISRRQFNDRRKFTSGLCASIRERVTNDIDGGEEYFCIDSMPVIVFQLAREPLQDG